MSSQIEVKGKRTTGRENPAILRDTFSPLARDSTANSSLKINDLAKQVRKTTPTNPLDRLDDLETDFDESSKKINPFKKIDNVEFSHKEVGGTEINKKTASKTLKSSVAKDAIRVGALSLGVALNVGKVADLANMALPGIGSVVLATFVVSMITISIAISAWNTYKHWDKKEKELKILRKSVERDANKVKDKVEKTTPIMKMKSGIHTLENSFTKLINGSFD